jgi:hypothetical protein
MDLITSRSDRLHGVVPAAEKYTVLKFQMRMRM